MNSRRVLVSLLILNLAQFCLIGFLLKKDSARSEVVPVKKASTKTSKEKIKPANIFTNSFGWRDVESSDYKAYIANLRGIGCPEETVRDIIIADVDKLFASKMRAGFASPKKNLKYWEPEPADWNEIFGEEKWKQERVVEKEKRTLLKELLGIDINSERKKMAGEEDVLEKHLSFLPAEKREQVKSVLEKFAEQEQNFREKALEQGGVMSAEDRAELKKIRSVREDELGKILSPQEMQLFELWTSDAAIAARHAMGGLDNPSEQDFLTIYKLRKQFEGELDPENVNFDTPATHEKWEKASVEIEEKLKTQLGDERYAEYQRGQDHDYRELAEISRRYNLPRETAGKIYDLRKSAENQTIKIQADQTLSEEKRKSLMQELRQSAGKNVQELLGEDAYKHYRRTESAGWLQDN